MQEDVRAARDAQIAHVHAIQQDMMDDVAGPLLDDCGGATALLAVHAGSLKASPDHGVELRVEAVCDKYSQKPR